MEGFLEKVKSEGLVSSLTEFIPVLIVFVVCLIVVKIVMSITDKIIKKSKLPKTVHTYVKSGIKFVLYFIVILIIADMLNIPITSLLAAFSVLGLAVSLAVQNLLTNVASGMNVLTTKPFQVGDFIEAGGVSGTVKDITLSHCRLRTVDNKEIFVPNNKIVTENIINFSTQKKRMINITIGVSYNENIDKVKEVLTNIAGSNDLILKEEPIFVGLLSYKDSSIEYTLRVWTKTEDYWTVYFDLQEKIKKAFDENKIEIPYNQIDVHMK